MDEQQDSAANFSYWLNVRVWNAHEAAALFLGFEPEYAERSFFGTPEKHRGEAIDTTNRLAKILESAQLAGEFGKVELNQGGRPWGRSVTWKEWITWAKQNDVELSSDLEKAADSRRPRARQDDESEEINPRRETTLLRTIAALLHILKGEPSQSEADAIRQIQDMFGHIPGIAKSTLQRDFAEAKRRLTDY